MNVITSQQIDKNLYIHEILLGADVETDQVKPVVEPPTHHIACYDVSGSMSGDLPAMRKDMCDKLATLLGERDTLTLVYFSGRGQCGTIVENMKFETAADLDKARAAIERWMRPIGLTGFKEPFELIEKVIARSPAGMDHSLFFLSDGCDNQWSKGEIFSAVDRVAKKLASLTVVEYGYFADRAMLASIAERGGGALVFADQFASYEPAARRAILKTAPSAPKKRVEVPGDVVGGIAYSIRAFGASGGDIRTYRVENGAAMVDADERYVYFLSSEKAGKTSVSFTVKDYDRLETSESAIYAAISLFATRMMPKVVRPLLASLGDVRMIDEFAMCFGKQKYTEFMELTKRAVFDVAERDVRGIDKAYAPSPDAFTVLQLLEILSDDESARVLLDDPSFKYSRISRGRVDAEDLVDDKMREEIAKLTVVMTAPKAKKADIEEARKKLDELKLQGGVKFEDVKCPEGYPINTLVWNEDRPNVSLQIERHGYVDLTGRIPKSLEGVFPFPEKFPTKKVRNYAIVRDGMINVEELPLRVSKETMVKLVARMSPFALRFPKQKPDFSAPSAPVDPDRISLNGDGTVDMVLSLKGMPVLNLTDMSEEISAKRLFERQMRLQELRARQKVLKNYRDASNAAVGGGTRAASGLAEKFGKDAAEFLASLGIKDYGFSPAHTVAAAAKDFYMGKELVLSLKGCMTIPSVADAKKKAPTNPMLVAMKGAVDLCERQKAALSPADFDAWIDAEAKSVIYMTREALRALAKEKFKIVVGQVWFKEFASLDDCTMTISTTTKRTDENGASSAEFKTECKAEMREVQIFV